MTATLDAAVIREIVESHPGAFRAGSGETPDCLDCGLPKLGAKTEDGPFCVRDHG